MDFRITFNDPVCCAMFRVKSTLLKGKIEIMNEKERGWEELFNVPDI